MKILYVTQYFPPETGAGSRRAFEMASAWHEAGHEVTVVCPFPNYPTGKVDAAYGGWRRRETLDGIAVVRVPIYVREKKTFTTRLGNYASFALMGAWNTLLAERPDVAYVSSPPLPVGLAGLVARLRGIPLFFEVRDLWPESARALGELRGGAVYRAAEAFERACYRSASRIVVVTEGIENRLRERGVPPEKLLFAPNGANLRRFAAAQAQAVEPERTGLHLFYGGLLGLAQGIPAVLEAMRLLKREPGFRFSVAGAGPQAAALAAAAHDEGLTNVTLLGNVPAERMPELIAGADLCLVPLAKGSLFEGALPSKMFEAWACRRPVLLSAAGEAARLVSRTGGGVVVPPEDPGSLAEAVHWLAKNRLSLREMGEHGRTAVQNYDRVAIARTVLTAMESAA